MTRCLAHARFAPTLGPSARRTGLCWEATRAPRWTRIPQAWVASAAQAGLLRDRQQSEKSQGFGDRVPELFPHQTKIETRGKSALALSINRRFTLNQYRMTMLDRSNFAAATPMETGELICLMWTYLIRG